MSRSLRTLLVAAVAMMTIAANAQTLRRVPIFRAGIYSDGVGFANLLLHNVYGTLAPEIVSCSAGSAFALTKSGSVYKEVWHSERVSCSAVAAGDVNGDGAAEVFVGSAPDNGYGSGTGSVYVFSPDRLGRHRASVTLPAGQQVTDIALGNVDGDAALEVVAISGTAAYVYNAATMALEWTATGRGGTQVAIADIEGNGMAEIIINGSHAHVLDASTQSLKWGYAGGFGHNMALGDVDADGKPEIVGATWSTITVVHGDTQTVSTFQIGATAQALTVGDGNNDGVVEVVTGDDQWGSVRGWNLSGQQLWYVNNPEHGVSGIAIGDPDGDGVNEAVWGAGYSSSGTDSLFVGNTVTHGIEWQAVDFDGPVHATPADLDGDGDLEVAVVFNTTDSGYDRGLLQVQNMRGDVEWSAYVGSSFSSTSRAVVGQFDADAAMEVLVVGAGRIYVYDGVTHALDWQSTSSGYANVVIGANIDADPVWEIIVGSGSIVQVLNGASPFVQASSSTLGSISDMALADVNNDAQLDLIAVTWGHTYILKASDLSERHRLMDTYAYRVAARTGEYALANGSNVVTYNGTTNAEQWRCSASGSSGLRYITLDGSPWLAAGTESEIALYPSGGTACPPRNALEHPVSSITGFDFQDVNADGKPELILSSYTGAEIDLFGSVNHPRGDADGDGQVLDADMAALSNYLYGNGTVPHLGADVNGDFSISPDDLFYLINYRRGTGAPPP